MSFQQKLLNLILERGQVSYDELANFTEQENHRQETMNRKMRLNVKGGLVEPIWKGKVIVGWKALEIIGLIPQKEINIKELSDVCKRIGMIGAYKPVEPKQPTLFP